MSFWTQSFKLTGEPGDQFGTRASINSLGNIALVGAPGADLPSKANAGAAYFYTGSGNNWVQVAKVTGSDGAIDDRFGSSVAINSSGNIAVIGAFNDDINGLSDVGSAYIFTGRASNWVQVAKIIANDGTSEDFFGHAVAINSSGDTILVGAYNDDVGGVLNIGSAYIFTGNGARWAQAAKITGNDSASGDFFGHSVAINSSGNIAVISAYEDDINGMSNVGSAYIFTGNARNWVQVAKITGNDSSANDGFGSSVAINSSGNIILIGAYQEDTFYTDQGAAYVFTGNGSNWTQTAKIIANDLEDVDLFGASVDLNAAGDVAIISASFEDPKQIYSNNLTSSAGAAYIFSGSPSNWNQIVKLFAPLDLAVNANYGNSVSINSLGQVGILGAYNSSAAYICTSLNYSVEQQFRDPCNFPGEDLINENFNFTLEGELNPDYTTKHKIIIYKSGSNTGYLPIHETEYSGYSSDVIKFNLRLDSGNYLSKVKSIYQENQQYTSFCNDGIQVLNLIDISRSNQSGFQVIKTSAELFFEEFLKENVKNKISNVFFSNNKYAITGFDFTNSTGTLRNSFTGIQIINSTIEGSAILEAVSYINRVSWNANPLNTIQIVNIITNSVPYIVADRVGDNNQDIRNIYFSPPFEIKYRDLENDTYNNIYYLNKNVNFIYFDKNLNVNLDPKNLILDENQIRLFYKNLAFKLNGSFSHNEISPMIRSINNARDIQKQRGNCV
jgi:hypothetical protein